MTEQAEVQSEVRGLLIPLKQGGLLVPNSTVAEIIDNRPPEDRPEGSPEWFLGNIMWRRRPLPVVSYERLTGHDFDEGGLRQRIMVCHGLNPDGPLFVGILSQGIPRLVRVSEENTTPDNEILPDNWPVLSRVNIGDDRAFVPDLPRLVSMVKEIQD